MSDSLLEDILACEQRIAERIRQEKHLIRARLDEQQQDLEQMHALLLGKLKARFTTKLTEERDRVEELCRQKESACRVTLRGQEALIPSKLAPLVERELLRLLRGDKHDHPDGQG